MEVFLNVFFIRYGISYEERELDPNLVQKRTELIVAAANELDDVRMIRFNNPYFARFFCFFFFVLFFSSFIAQTWVKLLLTTTFRMTRFVFSAKRLTRKPILSLCLMCFVSFAPPPNLKMWYESFDWLKCLRL